MASREPHAQIKDISRPVRLLAEIRPRDRTQVLTRGAAVPAALRAAGPLHVIDSEQIRTVLDGELTVAITGESHGISAGDTVVIPADQERQVAAGTDVRLLVCGHASAVARIPGEAEPRGTPPWIAGSLSNPNPHRKSIRRARADVPTRRRRGTPVAPASSWRGTGRRARRPSLGRSLR